MNGLVAEKRLNKNGVMVTRWVKPSSGASPSKALPAPQSGPDKATTAALAELEDLFDQYGFESLDYKKTLRKNMRNMGSDAKAFMERLWDHTASDLIYDIADVTDTIYGINSVVPHEHRTTVLMNFMDIIPEYFEGKDNEGVHAAHFAAILFRGIDGYSRTEPFTEDERLGYKAAATVTEAVFPNQTTKDPESKGFYIENQQVHLLDRESAEVLVRNAASATVIADHLIKRNTFRAEAVQQFAEAGALGDGTL